MVIMFKINYYVLLFVYLQIETETLTFRENAEAKTDSGKVTDN